MLFYNHSIRNNDFRPETCLGMDNHAIPQHHAGSDHGIVFDTAVFPDMRVIIDDASRNGAVRPDNDPVVKR